MTRKRRQANVRFQFKPMPHTILDLDDAWVLETARDSAANDLRASVRAERPTRASRWLR